MPKLALRRRQFIGLGLTGLAGLAIGVRSGAIGEIVGDPALGASTTLDLTIGEALVEMVDLTPVYMWTFGDASGPRVPGPVLHALEGDTLTIRVRNTLDEPHAFAIHGTAITTGPIAPGATVTLTTTAPAAGTYIYLDPLNAPVNRLLGLHGTMVVLPAAGNCPYSTPTPAVRALFDDLGTAAHFPGEPWKAERTRIWHVHTVDPVWHAMAQDGQAIDARRLIDGYRPRYFTLNGASGFFASHNPKNAPIGNLGQPFLIRITNTGMCAHSLHIHGNHIYIVSENGTVPEDAPWIDSWQCGPLDRVDWLLPMLRPPDIPGPANRPLRDVIPEELGYLDSYGLPQAPLEFPMHCHMEPSQTAAGGNYPGGLVTHWAITGDVDGRAFPTAPAAFLCAPLRGTASTT